jgi:ESAT-6 protein secretion system EspG family protein
MTMREQRGHRQPVSRAAFDVLWGMALPGQPRPPVLHGESPGSTADERAWVVAEATARLRAADYVGPRGVSDEMSAVLGAVCRPQRAIDLRLFEWAPPRPGNPPELTRLGARIAVAGAQGGVVVFGHRDVRAWSFPRASLVSEVLSLIEEHPPARFGGVALDPGELRALDRGRGADAVLRMAESPFVRRAHLCAVAHDHVLGRTKVSPGITLNDTAAGRFLVFTDRNQLIVNSGQRSTLTRKLRELAESHGRY